MEEDRELIFSLLECEVLKIGNYELKSGDFSPIYIDLRKIIHYPKVMKDVVSAIRKKQIKNNLKTDCVCGVPYTAIPIASIFSAFFDIPMVMKRKETKDYGTKKLIEGAFKAGDFCLLLEDVVCSGTSVMNTVEALRKERLNVHDCVVVVDKEQGGIMNLKKIGINLHSLFNLEAIFNVYCSINRIEAELIEKVTTYLKENPYMPIHEDRVYPTLSIKQRIETSNHPMAKRLLQIIDEKKTNLCVAVDTRYSEELIKFAEQLGPHICILQTHIDILDTFDESIIEQLTVLSSSFNFLILEDRKFANIGETVIQQYKSGICKIEKWADLVTVHGTNSSNTIKALKSSASTNKRACILAIETNATNEIIDEEFKGRIFQVADDHIDFVIGYTASKRNMKGKNLICLYDSIKLSPPSDSHDENYKLLEEVIADGADIIIANIDRHIVGDVVASAIEYKTRCFKAYLSRIS